MGPCRFLFVILMLVLVACLGTPAAAQNAKVGIAVDGCVARLRPGDRAAAMLATPARFDCRVQQRVLGAGDFWVRLVHLPAGLGLRPLQVRSASLWQRQATLYVAYADGAIVHRVMDDRGASRALQIGAVFDLPVPVRGVPVTAIVWRIDGAANVRGILAEPTIATPEEGARSNLVLGSLYAAFGGLALALLVYNLALWAVLRHRFQIAYCAMLAALATYAVSSSGVLGWWTGMGNTDRLRANYVLLALTGIFAIAFACHFFEKKVVSGRLRAAAVAVATLLGLSSVAFAVLAPWQARLLDAIYGGSFMGLIGFAGVVLWRAWRLRSNHLWIFALAWAAPIAVAALHVASHFHLVRFSFILDSSTLAAMTVEALLSGVAIAYRIRLLLVERDVAIAGEAAARALADTDHLTGLLNRRAFLREAIGRPGQVRLVLADIDHFKQVNDTLGHDRGDEVLRRFARALADAASAGALVARLGGEEFAILGPDHGEDLADTIMATVRAMRMPYDLTVTASLGSETGSIATEGDWARLYRGADQALLDAKRAGRDRVRHASGALAA